MARTAEVQERPVRLSESYRARPRGTGWRRFECCQLPISVGQPYHEGAKLEAAVDWVNAHAGAPFTACEIVVADTLQRHSIAALDDVGLVEAHERASRRGAAWIERNRATLTRLCFPYTLRRWDELLHHPRYPAVRADLYRLYRCNAELRTTIDTDACTFVDRVLQRTRRVRDIERLFACSRDYIIEEFTVEALLGEMRPQVALYPGSLASVEELFRSGRVPEAPAGLAPTAMLLLGLKLAHRR